MTNARFWEVFDTVVDALHAGVRTNRDEGKLGLGHFDLCDVLGRLDALGIAEPTDVDAGGVVHGACLKPGHLKVLAERCERAEERLALVERAVRQASYAAGLIVKKCDAAVPPLGEA